MPTFAPAGSRQGRTSPEAREGPGLLHALRQDALAMFERALAAVEPGAAVTAALTDRGAASRLGKIGGSFPSQRLVRA